MERSNTSLEDKISQEKIIAVVVINSEAELKPCMEALLEGGVRAIELAQRSPYSLEAARRVAAEYPEILLGAGTVLERRCLEEVKQAGVSFAVAPGCNPRVMQAATEIGLPFYPGISTASELEQALEYDVKLLKFFPAELLGGLKYLKSLHAPYAHLGLKYIPLGGLSQENLETYLKSPMIAAIGGSWLASRPLIEAGEWKKITQHCKDAIAVKESN